MACRSAAPARDPVIEKHTQVRDFEAAYDAMTGRYADAERAQERLILLLAGLLRDKPPSSVFVPPELARAKARIDDDPAAPITVSELAREAGLSRFQVVRGFAKFMGLTPHAYIVQRRLDAARAMIAANNTRANAAAACGFADQSHFWRSSTRRPKPIVAQFRRIAGTNPTCRQPSFDPKSLRGLIS